MGQKFCERPQRRHNVLSQPNLMAHYFLSAFDVTHEIFEDEDEGGRIWVAGRLDCSGGDLRK